MAEEIGIRDASRDALKYGYYVIIGIAITQALSHTFMKDNNFLGMRVFKGDNLISFILLSVAFLPTICRFVHGASIHLAVDGISKKRYKPIVDFCGYCLSYS